MSPEEATTREENPRSHRMLHGDFSLTDDAARRQELKHRFTEAVRALDEEAALLDAGERGEEELVSLLGAVEELAERIRQGPSLRRFDGLNNAPDWQAALTERSPISGRSNPVAAPLELWSDGDVMRGRAVYGRRHEGPVGFLHGGVVVGAFDELLGVAQSISGQSGMTGTLTIRMRRPTPLFTEIAYEGGVDRVEGRKVFAWGRSYADDQLLCESEGVFIAPRDFTHPDGHGRPRS